MSGLAERLPVTTIITKQMSIKDQEAGATGLPGAN